jgi:hypothetical protein
VTARVARDAAVVTIAAVAFGLMVAGIVIGLAGDADVRAWYGLTPEDPLVIPAWELWVHNMRVSLVAFGAALAVGHWNGRLARGICDVVMYAWLGWNVLLVAVAFGAYGDPLLRLAPAHYVFELLALAVAAAAYLDARRERAVRLRVLVGCALVAAVLLVGAAVTEGTV